MGAYNEGGNTGTGTEHSLDTGEKKVGLTRKHLGP
jgi:hypothetical protein